MRTGEVIAGRYRIDGAVGEGGMGAVWRATDLELRRVVAVKRANDGRGEQIRREARIGAGLQHPNIVAVHDVVGDGDERWLVMEYLPGSSLAEILRTEGSLTPPRAARIGAQIADALAAMHARGMVHRDVTPANILVGEDGTAKLTDLGIATWSEVTVTGSASNPGTPGYMAPEVVRGHVATPVSDVYSLGVVLSAVLEGVAPNPLAPVVSAMTDEVPSKRPAAGEAGQRLLDATSRRFPRRLVAAGGVVLVAAAVATTVVWVWPSATARTPLSGPEFVGDPATADVCRVADSAILERFGPVKVDSDYGDYTRCAFLVSMGGDEDNVVNVSVWLETGPDPDSGEPARRVSAGQTVLDRREPSDNYNYCQLYVHLPVRYRVGITAENVDGRPANLCTMADALVDGVYAAMDRGPLPRRPPPEPGSLGAVDACALLDSHDVAGPLAAEGVRAQPGFGGWQCMWIAQDGNRRVLVTFNRIDASYDEGVRTRFGARDGILEATGWGETKCLATVVYRPYVSVDQQEDKLEVVQVVFRSDEPSEQRCASTTAMATAVANKLPR